MRIVSLGMDLVECGRLADVVNRHGSRFIERILTEAERAYVGEKAFPMPHISGRFAAKEAIFKALGTGLRGNLDWLDIEILNDGNGQPLVALRNGCADLAKRNGVSRMLITITHTREHAAATAIAVAE